MIHFLWPMVTWACNRDKDDSTNLYRLTNFYQLIIVFTGTVPPPLSLQPYCALSIGNLPSVLWDITSASRARLKWLLVLHSWAIFSLCLFCTVGFAVYTHTHTHTHTHTLNHPESPCIFFLTAVRLMAGLHVRLKLTNTGIGLAKITGPPRCFA